jgi:surfeit locus 1 family protein
LAKMRPRHWAFLITALAVAAACVRLGFWQLSRLIQRRQSNDLVRSQMAQPPIETSEEDLPADLTAYRRVVASGTLDSSRQVILLNRSHNDEPGSHLITPLLPTSSGPAILVDRGWIPYDDGTDRDLSALDPPGSVQIHGILLASQPEPTWSILADPPSDGEWRRSWRNLNLERLQAQFPYPILQVYLAQTDPLDSADMPRPDATIDLSEGPHLSYAIQWFSFALIALVGGGIWLRRQLVDRPGDTKPGPEDQPALSADTVTVKAGNLAGLISCAPATDILRARPG